MQPFLPQFWNLSFSHLRFILLADVHSSQTKKILYSLNFCLVCHSSTCRVDAHVSFVDGYKSDRSVTIEEITLILYQNELLSHLQCSMLTICPWPVPFLFGHLFIDTNFFWKSQKFKNAFFCPKYLSRTQKQTSSAYATSFCCLYAHVFHSQLNFSCEFVWFLLIYKSDSRFSLINVEIWQIDDVMSEAH